MTAPDPLTWRMPPRWVLLVGVLSIVCAEVAGASMARFKLELARWARGAMLAHPTIHGLVGVRDVDERILDEALVKFDAGLRLFHMHAEGMGLVVIAMPVLLTCLLGLSTLLDRRLSEGLIGKASQVASVTGSIAPNGRTSATPSHA